MHFFERVKGSVGCGRHVLLRPPSSISSVLCLLSSVLFLSGCETLWTDKSQYSNMDRILAQGNFSAAEAEIQKSSSYQPKDRALYNLDLGILQHYLGQHRASNRSLEQAEQAMDAAFTKSITRAATSLLLNDNALEYSGEDYENVYVNVFKALNYLALEQLDSAFVEIRRIDEKLKVLESRHWKVAQKYQDAAEHDEPFRVNRNRFRNSALGRWLSLLIYRAEGRLDEAAIDLKKIAQAKALAPDMYNFRMPDFSSALKPPSDGRVKVPLLGLIGQAPEKRAETLWIHTQPDQIFIVGGREGRVGRQRSGGSTSIHWPGIEPGYTFKFQLPKLVKRGTDVASIRVKIDGRPGPVLLPIESLENAAEATFQVQKPLTYLKTVSRTVTKGIAAAQAQRKAEEKWGELHGLITGLLAGVGVGVTENADLRISRFFPARACVAETELAPGMHRIAFDYLSSGGLLLYRDQRTIKVDVGEINLIESVYLN